MFLGVEENHASRCVFVDFVEDGTNVNGVEGEDGGGGEVSEVCSLLTAFTDVCEVDEHGNHAHSVCFGGHGLADVLDRQSEDVWSVGDVGGEEGGQDGLCDCDCSADEVVLGWQRGAESVFWGLERDRLFDEHVMSHVEELFHDFRFELTPFGSVGNFCEVSCDLEDGRPLEAAVVDVVALGDCEGGVSFLPEAEHAVGHDAMPVAYAVSHGWRFVVKQGASLLKSTWFEEGGGVVGYV